MDNDRLLEILLQKGINKLYHANTVLTACTFLQHGALLSRQYVETNDLLQTAQASDEKDKQLGVWGDIFLDNVDIHYRANKRNKYGPVLFVMDTERLLSDKKFNDLVYVARDNPIHWEIESSDPERYFQTPKEVQAGYWYGDFAKSLLFRTGDGQVNLQPYLEEIILDDPDRQLDGESAFEVAQRALQECADKSGLSGFPIRRRDCSAVCKCQSNYNSWNLKPMFKP